MFYFVVAPNAGFASVRSSRQGLIGSLVESVFFRVLNDESSTVKRHSQDQLGSISSFAQPVINAKVLLQTKYSLNIYKKTKNVSDIELPC